MAEVKIVVKNQVDNKDAISQQSTQLQKLNKDAMNLAKGGLAAVGIAMAVFTKQSLDAASNVEESASKFKYVFGPAALEAGSALDEFAAAVGRSKYQLRDTAAGFGGILEGMLGSKEAAADMSVEFAKLTTDLSSFYNVSESEAATALTSGLVGETEPMRRFGVLLSEATVTAEILGSGMAATKNEITEAMKVQARYNIIMEATATAQGDAERTSDSYANQQRAMQASIEELSVAFGQLLIPIATEAAGTFAKLAQDLKVVIDVSKDAKPTIDSIVRGNIEQAKSVDDLVIQYQNIQKQLKMWGGAAVILTGTQDDLVSSSQEVLEATLRMADGAEDYVQALEEMGVVGTSQGQMSRDRAIAMYEEEKATLLAADALAEMTAEASGADTAMLDNVSSTKAASGESDGYNLALIRLAEGYKRAATAGAGFKEKTGQSAEALQEAREAAEATATAFEGSFSKALENNTAVYGKWVTTATAVGGMTEEQQENFDELSSEAERLRDNIQSLQGGTDGLGLTTDELNEKLGAQYEKLALVEGALAPLTGITTTYTDAQKVWVVDAEALNEQLFNQIDAQSNNAIVTAGAAIALGLYDEAQIATALNAAIIEEKINLLADAFVAGDISAREMQEQMEAIVNGSPYTSEIEVLTAEAMGNIDKVRDKLKALDGYTITTHVKVQTDEVSAPGGGSDKSGGAAGGSPGGAPSSGGTPNTPGYATGGVVPGPMGAPQLAIVHGGEEVLTPSQRRDKSGANISISFAGAIFQGTSQQQAAQLVSIVAEQLGRL